MTVSEITSHYIWARHTDTDGKATLQQHLVWSSADSKGAEKLIAARQRECDDLNAKARADKKPAKAAVQQITEEQYRRERSA